MVRGGGGYSSCRAFYCKLCNIVWSVTNQLKSSNFIKNSAQSNEGRSLTASSQKGAFKLNSSQIAYYTFKNVYWSYFNHQKVWHNLVWQNRKPDFFFSIKYPLQVSSLP
ncbi:TPA: hypothetical protein GDO54_018609 [Pyxicephalus adspersus]|uniref:Uncharacterized protein n=1 Tax=Pyxicephalus adspersus TaxID=30357 RepID=A0AAV2ZDI2_PYXAD|nr:TPA: hypothetical protein GDO54_018609 [Pyxicephalus adspersus]